MIGVDAGTSASIATLERVGVELHLGEQGVALLERASAVIKSPGVPARAPVIAAARERGMPVLGELELAWRMLGNEFIAVTGTNGKTTTVELIGHIHRHAGLPAAVAGNVGTPLSSLVDRVEVEATVICEASSFQLEDTLEFAPEAAVLLNLTPDHLDRHETMAAYLAAKLEIFARQGSEDVAVLPASLCTEAIQPELGPARRGFAARRICFGRGSRWTLAERDGELWWRGSMLLAVGELPLRGRHNVENAMAAAAVCLSRGLDPDAVRAGLRSFGGVPHRLEEVARRDGVLYVNDSKATNVASTLVALNAFAEDLQDADRGASPERPAPTEQASGFPAARRRRQAIHLILGGQGKGQDFAALRGAVERNCAGVYLIGEDAAAIAGALLGAQTQVRLCRELELAVADAGSAAAPGEVVLLSPACASFDQFTDFEARGERFREFALRAGGGALAR